MTDARVTSTKTYKLFYDALDKHGVGVVATIIEKHGIAAVDRFGRVGHRAPDSAEAAGLLEFCARRHDDVHPAVGERTTGQPQS